MFSQGLDFFAFINCLSSSSISNIFFTFPHLLFPSPFAIDQNTEAADKQETGKTGVLILVFFK